MKILAYTTLAIMFLTGVGHALELDESPSGPAEWGYRPGDGETPVVNPPGFSWRPCPGAANYILEVARDRDFGDVVYASKPMPWTGHCPPEPLPEGKLFWRYAAEDKDGARTPWSTVRAFDVSATAAIFPQPLTQDLVARMPAEHPRLLFRPEDVTRLRELSQTRLAERWKGLLDQAAKLLESPPDSSEPPLYPEDVVRGSGEWKKIWWGNRQHMIEVTDGAATLGFVYQLTGEQRYAAAARDLLLAMARWDVNGSTNLKYNDEAAMPALYMASRAYDWIHDTLSEDDRAIITASMRQRGQQAFDRLRREEHLWKPYNSHSNRLWHKMGELAIAFHGEIPEADTWLDYAMTNMFTAYPVWGDADGGWHEGTAYWSSYTSRYMAWVAVVRSAFSIDAFQRPFYGKTGYYGMYSLPPGSGRTGFADLATDARGIAQLMAILAANARDPHWQWYAEQTGGQLPGGYLGYLYAANAGDLAPEPPSNLPSSACFRGTGLALMNTDLLDGTKNLQVQFKSSPFGSQSHGYDANNAFLLNMRGQQVLLRSGRRDLHGSEHHRDWMWHTKSCNAILVNHESQIKHSPQATGRITFFETTPGVDAVAGEAGDSYLQLSRWTRRIVFLKPYAVVLHDVLEANEPSTFQFVLHTPGSCTLGENELSWAGDHGSIVVRFLEPAGLVLSQTDQFDPPPAEWANFDLGHWHITADAQEPAALRTFLTVILLDGFEPELAHGAGSLMLNLPDGAAEFRIAPEALDVVAPGFKASIP